MWEACSVYAPRSVRTQLVEALVVNAKIMRQFVKQGFANACARLVVIRAVGENGLPIKTDLVWQDQTVIVRALGERDAVIKAEQVERVVHLRRVERGLIRQLFDDDGDIRDVLAQLIWNFTQRLLEDAIKIGEIQHMCSIPQMASEIDDQKNVFQNGARLL